MKKIANLVFNPFINDSGFANKKYKYIYEKVIK